MNGIKNKGSYIPHVLKFLMVLKSLSNLFFIVTILNQVIPSLLKVSGKPDSSLPFFVNNSKTADYFC